jgi:hypothetical protein
MNLLALLLTLLLFLGPVFMAVNGWPIEGFGDKYKVMYLYPSFYILTIVIFVFFTQIKFSEKRYKYALYIIIVTFLWYIFNKITGGPAHKNALLQSITLPAMYYVFYEYMKENKYEKDNIKKLLIFLFIFNALMAIYERLTLTLYYPYDLIRSDFDLAFDDEEVFRSSGMLGHPLTNALIMSIMMTFILVSDINIIIKYCLYFIGFFSLFCFNARAAIVISAGIFVLYIIRPLFKKKATMKSRLFGLLFLFAFVFLGVFLIESGYGGRFEARGDISEDNSALARLDVFDIIIQYGVSNFLWGLSGDEVDQIAMAVLGMTHIENWFILSIMYNGLIITSIVTLLFVPIYRNATLPYNKYASFLIFISTIVLGSTNNSFATGIPALSIFFACCYAFSPSDCEGENIENDTTNCPVSAEMIEQS